MTLEEAIIDYFTKITGTLVSIFTEKGSLSVDEGLELIQIISAGINEIESKFKLQKSTLDSNA